MGVCLRDTRALLFLAAHAVIMVAMIAGFVIRDPKWNWAYQETFQSVEHHEHTDRHGWNNKFFSRLIDPHLSEHSCSSGGGDAVAEGSSFWDDEVATHENGRTSLRMDMCRFSHVPSILEEASDPRAMHIFGSATPRFLFMTIQVGILSHAYWQFSPINLFMRTQGLGKLNRIPWDLILSWTGLVAWGVFSMLRQEKNRIVYNNILASWLFCFFSGLLQLLWSWRSRDAGPVKLDKLESAKNLGARAGLGFDVNLEKFVSVRGMTNMPCVLPEEQGVVPGTLHIVWDYIELLEKKGLASMGRMMLFVYVFPLVVVASLLSEDSWWGYNNILLLSLVVYAVVSLISPLYLVCITAFKVRGQDEDVWFIVGILLVIVALLCVIFLMVFCFSLTYTHWQDTLLGKLSIGVTITAGLSSVLCGIACMGLGAGESSTTGGVCDVRCVLGSYVAEVLTACVSLICIIGVYQE